MEKVPSKRLCLNKYFNHSFFETSKNKINLISECEEDGNNYNHIYHLIIL